MTDNEINIAIAEACGWTRAHEFDYLTVYPPSNKGKHTYRKGQELRQIDKLPNYCNDLNAMHEAEKTFAGDDATVEKYWLELYDATEQTRWPYDATARQRAEALLRTLGKWKD